MQSALQSCPVACGHPQLLFHQQLLALLSSPVALSPSLRLLSHSLRLQYKGEPTGRYLILNVDFKSQEDAIAGMHESHRLACLLGSLSRCLGRCRCMGCKQWRRPSGRALLAAAAQRRVASAQGAVCLACCPCPAQRLLSFPVLLPRSLRCHRHQPRQSRADHAGVPAPA